MPWIEAGGARHVWCDRCDNYPPCAHIAVSVAGRYWADRIDSACHCGCGDARIYPTSEPVVFDELNVESQACGSCQNRFAAGEGVLSANRYGENSAICTTCAGSYRYDVCCSCDRHIPVNQLYVRAAGPSPDGDEDSRICRWCVDNPESGVRWYHCTHCNRWHSGDDSWVLYDQCCGEDTDEDGALDNCDCSNCYSIRHEAERRRERIIHNYSYRPTPDFRGGQQRVRYNRYREPYDATPYMGWELEVETSGVQRIDIANEVQQVLGDFVYLKEDGSISNGFEIVSHPATLDYWMSQFNWAAIRQLRKERKIRSEDNCGLHIHVSKNGFSGAAHEYRWLLFWYRNQEIMQAMAGRESNYARYSLNHRASFKQFVKNHHVSSERYSAINVNNEHTYEVRVFASTLFVNRLQASLQLVEASVEYTRSLASAKILKDGGFCWSEFVAWLRTNTARYAVLIERIARVTVDMPVMHDQTPRIASDRFQRRTNARDIFGDRLYEYFDIRRVTQDVVTAKNPS